MGRVRQALGPGQACFFFIGERLTRGRWEPPCEVSEATLILHRGFKVAVIREADRCQMYIRRRLQGARDPFHSTWRVRGKQQVGRARIQHQACHKQQPVTAAALTCTDFLTIIPYAEL